MGCCSGKPLTPPIIEIKPPPPDEKKPPFADEPSQEVSTPKADRPSRTSSAGSEDPKQEQEQEFPPTPVAKHREDQVRFDASSHDEIDCSKPGEVQSVSFLSWKESCWSGEEISASHKRRGVSFQSSFCFLMAGLKAAPGKAADSYASVDFAIYCMEHGRVQVFELGELKYTHKAKYTPETVFQIRIVGNGVEYVMDDAVVYKSETTPASSLHFQATFNGHPCVISNLCYVETETSA